RLQFNHSYGFEDDIFLNYDGGVIEFSTNGGSSWSDAGGLISAGATYGGAISSCCSNPLAGRNAFVKDSFGYTASQLDLTSLAGQNVRFRFRIGTDQAIDDYGWFIDDIRIYRCAGAQTPDLTITKTHSGNFRSGQKGAIYTLTVRNVGSGPTSGTVTVSDAVPTGLTATSISGSGWSCTQPGGPCARGDALAAGSSYPALTLKVDVALAAASSVTTTATVSGGGDVTSANNTATDPTTIDRSPDLVETSVSNPPSATAPGASFTVTDRVQNQGGATAAASKTRYYLSLNTIRDAGDTLLTGSRSIPSLIANAGSTGSVTVTVPPAIQLGTYYLLACADDTLVVVEGNEDNCMPSATTVQVTRPDLAVTKVSNPPASAAPGGRFTVTDTVSNQGTVSA